MMIKLNKLKNKKHQVKTDCTIVEGSRLIKQLIDNKIELLDIYTWQDSPPPAWLHNFHPKIISKKRFLTLSSTLHPQDYIAIVSRNTHKIGDYQTLLYLEKISDPGNLGTIIRTALALGIDGIALSPKSCDIFNPKVIRSSLGAVFTLPIEVKSYQWLQEQKAQKIVADLIGTPIYDLPPLAKKKILILGSEAAGVSQEIKKICELSITIPLTNKMESLNLSIAAGICLSHIIRSKP